MYLELEESQLKEKFLPIGSVVILKDATKRIMVTGYLSVDENNKEKVYDYNGCVYPEGFLSSEQVLLFNHDQIDKVFFEGMRDEEQKSFAQRLNEFAKKQENSQKKIESLEE